MDLENINYKEVMHKKFKKCEFCGRELEPIGFEYLYANISPENIHYKRCTCNKAKEYWKEIDMQQENEQKRKRFRNTINTIYKQNYIGRKLQDYNFNNFQINSNNQYAVKVANDYINKNNSKLQSNGLIIMGKSGVGKTHLAAAIANK